jgi:hypothetical protein
MLTDYQQLLTEFNCLRMQTIVTKAYINLTWNICQYLLLEDQNVTLWSRVLFEKQLILIAQTFLAFYRPSCFFALFTVARQWILSWASCIYFTISYTVSLRSILLLFSKLCIGYRRFAITSAFWQNLYFPILPCTLQAPHWFDHHNNVCVRV